MRKVRSVPLPQTMYASSRDDELPGYQMVLPGDREQQEDVSRRVERGGRGHAAHSG